MRAFWGVLGFAIALIAASPAKPAHACGGFFCGFTPVDQTAERVVFKVHADSTTMITQIAYTGDADDFAWVLPLAEVPDVMSLKVFPQRALTALDAQTGPQFQLPNECQRFFADATAGAAGPPPPSAAGADDSANGVTVHFRAEVGPYDVAAIESKDPMALFKWLQDNEYNVNEVMLPYIEAYTKEGMKFLAAKLQKDKDTSDIQPLQFDLPGTTPSIPLRMTAIAAEPEMSFLVFVFGADRHNGANWPDVEIPDDKIAFKPNTYPQQTNWTALVARGVDEAGGQGWVTELAGSTDPIVQLLNNSTFATPDDEAAGKALLDLMDGAPYVSRLYSRLSAEEMTSDPIFHRTSGGDVSRLHMLSRIVDGVDQCPDMPVSIDPCLFTSCGAGGICRPVLLDGMESPVAGCGCIDGATARTTFDPISVSLQADGTTAPAAAVVCQDARMSFVNPGDKAANGAVMVDPCKNFDCGKSGECLAVNMTPTCVCDHGYVALGNFASDGSRSTHCEQPMIAVPKTFYGQRLPDLPTDLPGGRPMKDVDMMLPVIKPTMNDLGSMGMPVPHDDGGTSNGGTSTSGSAGKGSDTTSGKTDTTPTMNTGSNDDCSVSAPGAAGGTRAHVSFALLSVLGFAWLQRRRMH
jgi:hypothetical protein